MCKKHSFWDLKTNFRKSFSFKNKNILIIETVQELKNVSHAKAVEMLMESQSLYVDVLKNLKEQYSDI